MLSLHKKRSDVMNLPNLKEARVRTNQSVDVIVDAYQVDDSMQEI